MLTRMRPEIVVSESQKLRNYIAYMTGNCQNLGLRNSSHDKGKRRVYYNE